MANMSGMLAFRRDHGVKMTELDISIRVDKSPVPKVAINGAELDSEHSALVRIAIAQLYVDTRKRPAKYANDLYAQKNEAMLLELLTNMGCVGKWA